MTTIHEDRTRLLKKITELQDYTGGRASIPRCLSIIQKVPCPFRCNHELRQLILEYTTIDPLYSAKHDYAKIKLIDAVFLKFFPHVTIKSEYDAGPGKLDITLLVDTNRTSDLKSRIIGIEIKTGKSIDLFQIERYLYQCDVLLIARVVHGDVSIIRATQLNNELKFYIDSIIEKLDSILAGNLRKIEGPWCRGCPAPCEFRKSSFTNNKTAPLDEISGLLVNVPLVIRKAIAILEKEIMINPSSRINYDAHSKDQRVESKSDEAEPQ